jgi:hypothetical protein
MISLQDLAARLKADVVDVMKTGGEEPTVQDQSTGEYPT